MGAATDAKTRIDALSSALAKMQTTTIEATRCCDQLSKRAHQLDGLTSPASGSSSMLSRANNNLAATLVLMKDAREKFDTVTDCEPAIEHLHKGVQDMEEKRASQGGRKKTPRRGVVLSEQDVYAASDSMEILRDAHEYFMQRKHWSSATTALGGLERVHKTGTESMCLLISSHLMSAGPGVRMKRGPKKIDASTEGAAQTRERLSAALRNRDLLKSIGDYEENQPVEARQIREIRAIFECLGSHGYSLGPAPNREPSGLAAVFNVPPARVIRSEKVGSGCYTKLTKQPLKTGFPQLDAYGESRMNVAFSAIDSYYRKIKNDRKKKLERQAAANVIEDADEADVAARDAVRCLENAMLIVAGEKNIFRAVVTPIISRDADEDDENQALAPFLKKAGVAAYSHAVAAVVDRVLDIIETVFLKEGGIGQSSGSKGEATGLTVSTAASAAAAGLRILDGVRMLGPSLAKLCEMPVGDGSTGSNTTIASTLCISIHRTTVKNAARTLENLAKAIQEDPLKGHLHRPPDASVSSVTTDTIRAIRLVSPFMSAYKSISKRRALPWDPNMGEEAGELDSFVRFLVMRLLNSLKGKALNYVRDGRDDSQAKSNLFLINNCFYLLEELGQDNMMSSAAPADAEHYRIEGSWFIDKVNKILESEKTKYLGHWEVLNTHLTAIGKDELEFQKSETLLTVESGRLLKGRFNGFNQDFERTSALHQKLCVIDPRLRAQMQQEVKQVFIPRYERFYHKYKKYRFSKKKQENYTKYSPQKIEEVIRELYTAPVR